VHVLLRGDKLREVLSVSAKDRVLERHADHEVAGEQAEEFLVHDGRDRRKGRGKGGADAPRDVMPMQLQPLQNSV
jgi:hypothetical protein